MSKRIISFILCLFGVVTIQAQYKASGQITNLQKECLPGTQIVLILQDSLAGMTLTDKNGNYVIEGLGKGSYLMQIDRDGYTPRVETVNLFKDMKMDFILLKVNDNRVNLL